MATEHIDPEEVETMLEECLEAIEDDEEKFTSWEISFLESIENFVNDRVLTDAQWEKLQQIHEEKAG